MLFTRTRRYQFSVPKEHLRYRLLGSHVKIHNMDFEVLEKEQKLHIIPHAEQVNTIKTLPITYVELKEDGNKTKVVITSEMRKLDTGGPLLIIIFCAFLLAASIVLLYIGKDPMLTYAMWGVAVFIFTLFLIRMQLGYFDYVRKIRSYMQLTGDQITKDVRQQLFKHKLK
ncbi:MAG: hypothetical protein JWQ38_443 [Flavipsychrobacter sp.]|nr:hypothetical protein [Flavipsychrobacter sp.]